MTGPKPIDLPEESPQDALQSMGGGIDREQVSMPKLVETPEEDKPKPEPAVEFIDDQERPVWQDRPSVKDQQNIPGMCREKYRKAVVLDLSDTQQLNEWNEYLDYARKGEGTVADVERQFFEGRFVVYAIFIKLEFKKLVPNVRKEDE